jgi:hypothetical protein
MNIHIRSAVPADAPRVAEIYNEGIRGRGATLHQAAILVIGSGPARIAQHKHCLQRMSAGDPLKLLVRSRPASRLQMSHSLPPLPLTCLSSHPITQTDEAPMEQALEVVRFRVNPENVVPMLAGREEAIAALSAECPGLISAHLAHLGDDRWIDVLLWETRELAEAAFERAMSIPALTRWFENIAEVGVCEHADVRSMIHG